jgi:hypothetical protein
MAKLSAPEQQAISQKAAELIAEEATMRRLRIARESSQGDIGKKL